MQVVLLQLSDIHFYVRGNPIAGRISELVAAVRSVLPRPEACICMVTGDVAWSGLGTEYLAAGAFFERLFTELRSLFPEHFEVVFIPGNHDCLLPAEEKALRSAVIKGSEPTLQSPNPDQAILRSLLFCQDNFFAFMEKQEAVTLSPEEKICRTRRIRFGERTILVYALNTALFTQREEKAGTLSPPISLLDRLFIPDPEVDLAVTVYHHPEGWLSPDIKRAFRKHVEGVSHVVLTGHEHNNDNHLVETSVGEQILYLDADALQDEHQRSQSGFNCLVVDSQA